MKRTHRGFWVAGVLIVGFISFAYATSPGEEFLWLSTPSSGGIQIGATGNPGLMLKVVRTINTVAEYGRFMVTSAGATQIFCSNGGYLETDDGTLLQATASGTAQLVGKSTGGVYALAQAHHDGSAYAASGADSSVTADNNGSAWMMGSGGGMVDTLADGTSRIVSSTANAVMATTYGDVIIRIGGVPQEEDSMRGGGLEEANAEAADVDDAALLEERAARIAAVKEEVDNQAL